MKFFKDSSDSLIVINDLKRQSFHFFEREQAWAQQDINRLHSLISKSKEFKELKLFILSFLFNSKQSQY